MEAKILEALNLFLGGDDEAALALLLEPEGEIVPAMATMFRQQADADLRAFIVRVAWERREPSSIDLIVDALNDPAEAVWQAALDGAVALASPEILDVLRAARQKERPDAAMTRRFQICVDEAILYVEGMLQSRQHPHLNPLPSRERR